MSQLIITQSIPSNYKLRVGYRKQNSGEPFLYLHNYLKLQDIPYLIPVDTGYYEVEITTLKRGLCSTVVNGPTIYKITSTPAPETTTTTTTTSTTTTSTTTTSTTTTSTTTTTQAPIVVKYDFFANDPGAPEDAVLTRSMNITHNLDYTIDLTAFTEPMWIIIEEPATETVKTAYYNTFLNNGVIPDQAWLDPAVVGSKRYYKSRGVVGFDPTQGLQFKKLQ